MTKDEVLKLALEALETAGIDGNCEYGATEIIRKALAQPERTWVGLTDEEVIKMSRYDLTYASLIGEVQRRLKEKNTYEKQ